MFRDRCKTSPHAKKQKFESLNTAILS